MAVTQPKLERNSFDSPSNTGTTFHFNCKNRKAKTLSGTLGAILIILAILGEIVESTSIDKLGP